MTTRKGRPAGPTDETASQVLHAAFALLSKEGPAALTPVRIHQESGVARTTVYRHWPTPVHIVEALMPRAIARDEIDQITGDLDHDLPIAVASLVFRLEHRPVHVLYDALRHHGDPTEEPTMSERYIAGLIAPVRDVLADAIERGDIDRETEGELDDLTSAICGPLILDHLLLGRPVPAAATDDAVDRFNRRFGRRGR